MGDARACDEDRASPGDPRRSRSGRAASVGRRATATRASSAMRSPKRRRREQRPDLAQVVIDDRLAAIEAQRRDQLPDALPRQLRVLAQQPVDLVLERGPASTPQARAHNAAPRRWRSRCGSCRDAARSGDDLPDRQAAHEMQPPHLRPRLHSDHLGLPSSLCANEPRLRRPPNAQAVHFSTGAGGPVFTRRRQPRAPAIRGLLLPPSRRSGHAHRPMARAGATTSASRGTLVSTGTRSELDNGLPILRPTES
jgi:hypothetical protein